MSATHQFPPAVPSPKSSPLASRSVPELPAVPSPKSSPLASRSVPEHLVGGALGLLAAIIAIVLTKVVGPVSLLLLGVTVFAWRGCPTCWAVGLMGTLADDKARRGCPRC